MKGSSAELTPYMLFEREKWASFRKQEPMTLNQTELETLKGINDELSIDEVKSIYLPLSRLLNFHIHANMTNNCILAEFLSKKYENVPYVIGISGSVSVGKSTTSRVLQALLSRWPEHCKVELVTTDGFLYPNQTLKEKGLMQKKGFPESYDFKRLISFLSQIKSGASKISVPLYSHLIYDVLPNEKCIENPDILIVEGLNILQKSPNFGDDFSHIFLSDYLDFSIYVDANENLLEDWYVSRFLKLRTSAFNDPESYFHHYAKIPENEAKKIAHEIWQRINLPNLKQNILPTKPRARLILEKGINHQIQQIYLRK